MNCTTLSAWKDEKNLSDISFLQVYEFEAIFDALCPTLHRNFPWLP